MKNIITLLLLFFIIHVSCISQQKFNNYFEDASLRIDFMLTGNSESQAAYLLNLKKEPYWGGPKKNLIDKFGYGEYRLNVFDVSSGEKIYTYGFCTLFEEWRTTTEAKERSKAFYQTVTCPYPRNSIRIEIKARNHDGSYSVLYETKISPSSLEINRDKPINAKVTKLVDNGPSNKNVDIAFIAEGYTEEEQDKFIEDIKRLTGYLFSFPPYDKLKDKFNIWAIGAISEQSGCDDPGKGIWVNTAVNSSFNTFGIDRYLESYDVRSIRDYAANAPYDQIYVLVNTKKYGGGGIYNHFSLTSADNIYSKQVFIHEFGHAFAGLGDEYYTSDVAYNDYFNKKIEPWQPNLTTLVDFDSKWKDMLAKDTPVPTPPTDTFKVGVYEGAGYSAKGIYRPAINCRMKTNEAKGFCPVCQKAITDMVLFLSDE
ncbi:MAG: peptidase M64 [Chlorobi bacterium]|nr:peptidase M64 [Chlorobiota bacterium]